MALLKTMKSGALTVKVFEDRKESGADAAKDGAETLRRLLAEKEWVNVIFAAAPSQNDTLEALSRQPGIDWKRVRAFHMDEYVGFGREKPQSFGFYLREHIFGLVPFGEVHYIRGDAENADRECERYAALLKEYPTDVVFLGIGENAHIAFNDPWIADFHDPLLVKLVPLDEVCRNQQVHDGCFPRLEDVPTHAFSLTVPALLNAKHLYCTVPCATKADAVYNVVNADIGEAYPATGMRDHPDATMYCDRASGERIL